MARVRPLMERLEVNAIAAEVLAAMDSRHQVTPFSSRDEALSLDAAYQVAAELRRLRMLRGEKPIGRKIGFTNRDIWSEYNVDRPIWGDMYDSTVRELSRSPSFSLSHLVEPRIEPEIVLKLSKDLTPDMGEKGLWGAIEWVAHGFE